MELMMKLSCFQDIYFQFQMHTSDYVHATAFEHSCEFTCADIQQK